ncbi:MAG: hypothetical protein IPJ65_14800 [Archangiaceae bacterium]|nr:hypothetical protein [Archangiaceae bacterium]
MSSRKHLKHISLSAVLALAVTACGLEEGAGAPDELGSVEGAAKSSGGGSGGGSSGTWAYPVPTGCVSVSPTACRTNVGHYDVIQAEASLVANMIAAGWTQKYSNYALCRTNDAFFKGTTKVCYKVGIVEDANHQVIGSQWTGIIEKK